MHEWIRILEAVQNQRNRLRTSTAEDLARDLGMPLRQAEDAVSSLLQRGLLISRPIAVGTRSIPTLLVTERGITYLETFSVSSGPTSRLSRDTKDRTPVAVSLIFIRGNAQITVRWEADVLGVRTSHLVLPFSREDTHLVTRVLDVLQYPNYPRSETSEQNRWFQFTAAEQVRLTALGLWSDHRLRVDAPRQIGRLLFRSLIQDTNASQAFGTACDHASATGQPLAFHLHFSPDVMHVAALPWELTWDHGPLPVLLSGDPSASCSFVRHLDLAQAIPRPALSGEPLRILAITPSAGVPARFRDAEREARHTSFKPLLASGKATLNELSPATPEGIIDAVHASPRPDVIHYYGHGRYQNGQGALLLDAPNGGQTWATVETVAALFGTVQLAVLHACQGAMVGENEDSLITSLTPALSAAGIPAVVGMQLAISAQTACRAASVIYRQLAAGASIYTALNITRRALFVENAYRAWYVPVLYVRSRRTDGE